jgi:DNA invertase Pin-like site-specific DNA recombinase
VYGPRRQGRPKPREDSGVEVVSVTEGRDQLARGVQLVVAEHYSRALAERMRHGLMQRFKQRASTGGPPPYGCEVVEGNGTKRRRIKEAQAAIVPSIFDDYLGGKGFKEIAHDLPAAVDALALVNHWLGEAFWKAFQRAA